MRITDEFRKIAESSGVVCGVVRFQDYREKIGKLRFKIFTELLGWVRGDPDRKMEIDNYDDGAIHLAAFSDAGEEMIMYARILEKGSKRGLMLEDDAFQVLLPKNFVIPCQAIEISRFCLSPEFQKKRQGIVAMKLIFKSIFTLMIERGYSHLLGIANGQDARGYSHKDFLLRLFPGFQVIGKPHRFEEGVDTFVLMSDILSIEHDLRHLGIVG